MCSYHAGHTDVVSRLIHTHGIEKFGSSYDGFWNTVLGGL